MYFSSLQDKDERHFWQISSTCLQNIILLLTTQGCWSHLSHGAS